MNRKGVTLVELVVVLAIIAIAAVLTIPNIGAWIPKYRLSSATRDIVSAMRSAQMKAVSTNTPYRVTFDDADQSYIIERNTAGLWVPEGELQRLPSGIEFKAITLPGKHAEFNPNSTASSGSVTLKNPKNAEKRIVLFSATGRIRVE